MNRPRLGCIADDFTGATDLANNLVRSGMRTVQTIGVPDASSAIADADAIVVALKSRTIEASDAVAQSLDALEWLQARGVEQIYFKYCSTFDSTPAGNIGPVTDALLDALHGEGSGFTIVCPAFPVNQRTVYKGHLFVGDRLLSESSMRQHPLTPMSDADLVRVMQAQTQRRVGLVAHEVVRLGHEAVQGRFAELKSQGIGMAVVDAVDDADLKTLGRATGGMALVTAGSGLAIGLPDNWRRSGQLRENQHAGRLPPADGLRAIVSGSCSAATNAQVEHHRQAGLPAFAVNPMAIAAGEDVVSQALAWAAPRLQSGPVLIYATADSDAVRVVQSKLGSARAGELVEAALSGIATGLVHAGVRQLVVAGGETSGAVVQALGVDRLTIGEQIDPGVPWTCGPAAVSCGQRVYLALKSGNFGTRDFFAKAFARLDQAR